MAFLVGLGRWQGSQFRVVQLLLPDQSDERALLAALAAEIPVDGWLVTYNGRTFDWPLLVTRFRMAGGGPPPHAGHLDLLPFVRRVFRHRMPDARLRSVESKLLGLDRHAPPHEHGSSHGETRITRLAIGEGAHYTPLAVRSHEIWREIERDGPWRGPEPKLKPDGSRTIAGEVLFSSRFLIEGYARQAKRHPRSLLLCAGGVGAKASARAPSG